MTRSVCAAALCCLVSIPAFAQDLQRAAAAPQDPTIISVAVDQLLVPATAPPQPLREAIAKRPLSLVPMYASLAVLNGLDYVSTRRALASGSAREANPVMGGVVGSPAAFFAVKAGATAGTIW